MEHERLIKRSRAAEMRLAGNLYCTIGVDKNDRMLGCGCQKLYSRLDESCQWVFASHSIDTYTIKCNAKGDYRTLASSYWDFQNQTDYFVFNAYSRIGYQLKGIYGTGLDAIVGLHLDGSLMVEGLCEDQEYNIKDWPPMEYISYYPNIILGVTKDGHAKVYGKKLHPSYAEIDDWEDLVQIKMIGPFIVGLKKNGKLVCTEKGSIFSFFLSSLNNVVSYDCFKGYVFYVVLSDGSVIEKNLKSMSELEDMFTHSVYIEEGILAVKSLPTGLYFIRKNGTVFVGQYDQTVFTEEVRRAMTSYLDRWEVDSIINNKRFHEINDWQLFDNEDELLAKYEAFEDQRYIRNGTCSFCGGAFKGLFTKKCRNCGRTKNY